MGGGGVVSRLWATLRAVAGAAVIATLLTGCPGTGSTEKEPNEVDEARAQALRDDSWLKASDVELSSYQPGSNNLYRPTVASAERPLRGTPEESVLAEVDAATDAGWVPFFAQCEGAAPPVAVSTLDSSLMVLVGSRLPDGTVAMADIGVSEGAVRILASVPNHASGPRELPPPVDVTDLSCFSPDGRGPDYVGVAVDVLEAS